MGENPLNAVPKSLGPPKAESRAEESPRAEESSQADSPTMNWQPMDGVLKGVVSSGPAESHWPFISRRLIPGAYRCWHVFSKTSRSSIPRNYSVGLQIAFPTHSTRPAPSSAKTNPASRGRASFSSESLTTKPLFGCSATDDRDNPDDDCLEGSRRTRDPPD